MVHILLGIHHWRLDSVQDTSSIASAVSPENEEKDPEKDAVEIPSNVVIIMIKNYIVNIN